MAHIKIQRQFFNHLLEVTGEEKETLPVDTDDEQESAANELAVRGIPCADVWVNGDVHGMDYRNGRVIFARRDEPRA